MSKLGPHYKTQAWWDVSCSGQSRQWFGDPPDPFKTGVPSPLRSIPGGELPSSCRPDLLHVFNLGSGADLAAGGLIAMVRMKMFPGRSIQVRLDYALERFTGWCGENRQGTSIQSFELKKFKMKSSLVLLK